MVKPASKRISSYNAKYDTTATKARLDALKPNAIKHAAKAFGDAVHTELCVSKILMKNAEYGHEYGARNIRYQNFAREIARRRRAGLNHLALMDWIKQTLWPKYASYNCRASICEEILHLCFSIALTL